MLHKENTIREIVNSNAVYHMLSDKLNIESHDHFKTLAQVCAEKSLNVQLFETLIRAYDDAYEFPYAELNQLSTAELVQYLQTSHNYYLQKKLPEIEQTAVQVFQVCNESHPLMAYLCLFFARYKKKLEAHIRYEEESLFPYIVKLLDVNRSCGSDLEISDVMQSFSTAIFLQNHSDIEEELRKVKDLIIKHVSGHRAPLPYKVFLSQLHYFEIELSKHALVEDEVLIPKVIALEKELLQRVKSTSAKDLMQK